MVGGVSISTGGEFAWVVVCGYNVCGMAMGEVERLALMANALLYGPQRVERMEKYCAGGIRRGEGSAKNACTCGRSVVERV